VARFGTDALFDRSLDLVRGARVGLVTNHTGFDSDRVATVDRLLAEPSVTLAALFAPEHGIRGDQDHDGIANGADGRTGVPVYSLFGKTREPTRAMLDGLDAILYDIQDVGARFYTYATTLSYAMKRAGEAGVRVIVLDRPNPIGGLVVEGPVLDSRLRSFVGAHEIALRHGLTMGELALMCRDEFGQECDLTVVPCEGWRRGMYFEDTGLPWAGPSPNLRTVEQAVLYIGPCLLEFSNLSVGRGTDVPFEVVGAPWVDAEQACEAARACEPPGVDLSPATFTPDADSGYPYAGQACRGLRMRVTDREIFRAVPLGIALATAIRDACTRFEMNRAGFARLCGSQAIVDRFFGGASYADLTELSHLGVEEFVEAREAYLMYPA